MAILGQHVGHHDGREIHRLVRVGREQTVGCKAVTQRVVAGFVVSQMQEGWLREIGRCYRRNLIVFIALALAVVGLKITEEQGAGSVLQNQRKYSIALVTATVGEKWQPLGKEIAPMQGREPSDLTQMPAQLLGEFSSH